MINKNFQKISVFVFAGAVVLFFLFAFVIPPAFANLAVDENESENIVDSTIPDTTTSPITHLKTPKAVKSIYMTQCIAGNKRLRARLVKLAQDTEINAIVINIKDETGKVAIKTDNPLFAKAYATARCRASDMKDFVAFLHRNDIYAIARIAVFQDPDLVKKHPEWAVKRASDGAVWRDRKGITWLEVKATPVWDYVAALAEEAEKIGFDEINFDYVRFPSDGNMSDIAYTYFDSSEETKADAVKDFFRGIHERTKDLGIPISVDLFGMASTNYDDLGIGQILENALPYFDFVTLMVYPSHYPPGYHGYKQPAIVPYKIVKYNMDMAVSRAIAADSDPAKIRPWIQDFNLGAIYDALMIRAQIQATYDAGLNSWMSWDPRNIYTTGAYLPD
ncbi:MAG: hypothetical protein A2X77_00485 [Gammaproteobacteria bacterium GWE2_42_36]|nr:MAG: hypothetical protein A2X77_00485 [Gammaproteobacteria bacterium GWE2_42_36]